jgi:hypothetical protein
MMQSMTDKADQLIDTLDSVDFKSMSFVQLRRLNAALADASERVAAITANRSSDDTSGDTVRVAVRPDRER